MISDPGNTAMAPFEKSWRRGRKITSMASWLGYKYSCGARISGAKKPHRTFEVVLRMY